MNLKTAMLQVGTVLERLGAADTGILTKEDGDAIAQVLGELIRLRRRAEDLNLLGTLAPESKELEVGSIPPPPSTQPLLPDEEPGA